MLSPKLSWTAKLSPCRYCSEAQPEITGLRNSLPLDQRCSGSSLGLSFFTLLFKMQSDRARERRVTRASASPSAVRDTFIFRSAIITGSFQLHQRYVKVPAAVADVLVAGAVSIHVIGRLLQRHRRQPHVVLLRVVRRAHRSLLHRFIAICRRCGRELFCSL